MIIEIDLFWLAGLVATLLAYRPLLAGLIKTVKAGVKAYKFAMLYVKIPTRQDRCEDRLDDLERAVFPEGAAP